MSFEHALVHLGLQVCWRMIGPQLPGMIAIAGFVLGATFAINLVSKFMGWQAVAGGGSWRESAVKGVQYRAKGGKSE